MNFNLTTLFTHHRYIKSQWKVFVHVSTVKQVYSHAWIGTRIQSVGSDKVCTWSRHPLSRFTTVIEFSVHSCTWSQQKWLPWVNTLFFHCLPPKYNYLTKLLRNTSKGKMARKIKEPMRLMREQASLTNVELQCKD